MGPPWRPEQQLVIAATACICGERLSCSSLLAEEMVRADLYLPLMVWALWLSLVLGAAAAACIEACVGFPHPAAAL